MRLRWARWAAFILVAVLGVVISLVVFFETDLMQNLTRGQLIRAIEERTGTQVEVGRFHLRPWRLEAELDDFTLHGLEGHSSPPLFHADQIKVGLRVLSFWGRRVALDYLDIENPQLFALVDKDGKSNLPTPRRRATGAPWRDTLFNLQIGVLQLRNGSATLNDRQVPLTISGHNFKFTLNYVASVPANDVYIGQLQWQQVEWSAPKRKPLRFDLTTKFTLGRTAFELDELTWKLPHSELNLRAELPSFAQANWNLHYRGRLSLADLRALFKGQMPEVSTEFSGEARYTAAAPPEQRWTASGYYRANHIRLGYQWFHARDMETWGNFDIARDQFVVDNLRARALAGMLEGRLTMDFRTLDFRAETHLHGASLGAALDAVNNPSLPVDPLHWEASMDVQAVNTWNGFFKNFRSTGTSTWSPPAMLEAGLIPITAHIDYDYSDARKGVNTKASTIATPTAQINFDGPISGIDSALEVNYRADDLSKWDDFINVIRGPDAKPERIAGQVNWRGRILGPIVAPTFAGHLDANHATYASFYWDQITGDMDYAPDVFRLTNTTIRRGAASAVMNLALQLDMNWGFVPASTWSLDGTVHNAPSNDFQEMLGTNYPVSGSISGDFKGGGTRQFPILDSEFSFEDVSAKGMHFDKLAGKLHMANDDIQISQATLRRGTGQVTGNVEFHTQQRTVVFDLHGKAIPLQEISEIQSTAMPVTGIATFNIRGDGPLRAPSAEGDLHIDNLKLGSEIEGNFSTQLTSDGQTATVSMVSDLIKGKLQGKISVGLQGDQPVTGELSAQQVDLDAFIISGLHLRQITGHSSADGTFQISGALAQPDSIRVDADISRISFNYEFVQLSNDQDIRISYRRNEVRVEQARLHGTDTDLTLSGSTRFDGDRQMHVNLSGGANLRLLQGLLPDLNARGRADVSVQVEGTMAMPRVTGRANIRDVAANYGDFPIGLSNMNGTLVFDKNRLTFDQLTAEAGGGKLALNGNLSYGDGPVRYQVTATTTTLRIRYPAGMSWLAGGTIELSGTSSGAVVSGNVEVQRLLFGEGVDVASFFAAASETTTQQVSTSPFLQNLTFDVQGQTAPGARIEWTGAQIDMDANVRLRGSWDRPIMLGNIHLLGGQMPFRGNTYELTRGDINFANPFRLDPVLNVEATSTISQYQVTVDFSGPASRLALSYRSDPPLPESDIIGLLALGRTGEETGPVSQSASQNYGATALLSEAISSGLGGRIEHLFGISQFRVDPFVAGTATESNAAARVTIQEQIRHDLIVTYSSNAATSNQYQLIQVEYEVKRDLSVVFLRDINGTYGMDIKWVKRLK